MKGKTMKKQIVLILLLAMLFGLAGCQGSQQSYFEQITQAVNDQTDNIIEALDAAEAIPIAALEDLNTKIDVIQSASIEAAKTYDEDVNSDKLGALIDAAIVANNVSAPVNPYYGPIGGVLTLIAGGYGFMQRKEKIVSNAKYKSHKQGVQTAMRTMGSDESEALYNEIGKARKANGVNT
jgi:hypothetical protein